MYGDSFFCDIKILFSFHTSMHEYGFISWSVYVQYQNMVIWLCKYFTFIFTITSWDRNIVLFTVTNSEKRSRSMMSINIVVHVMIRWDGLAILSRYSQFVSCLRSSAWSSRWPRPCLLSACKPKTSAGYCLAYEVYRMCVIVWQYIRCLCVHASSVYCRETSYRNPHPRQ